MIRWSGSDGVVSIRASGFEHPRWLGRDVGRPFWGQPQKGVASCGLSARTRSFCSLRVLAATHGHDRLGIALGYAGTEGGAVVKCDLGEKRLQALEGTP